MEGHDLAYNKLEVSKYCVQNKTEKELEMTGHEACLFTGVSGKDVLDWRKSQGESPKAGVNLARVEDAMRAVLTNEIRQLMGEEAEPVHSMTRSSWTAVRRAPSAFTAWERSFLH